MTPRLPRWTLHAVLALLLLLAQQRAMLHWLSHDLERAQASSTSASGKAAAGASHYCDECAAYAGLASALPKADFRIPAREAGAVRLPAIDAVSRAATAAVPYLSRAPPVGV